MGLIKIFADKKIKSYQFTGHNSKIIWVNIRYIDE